MSHQLALVSAGGQADDASQVLQFAFCIFVRAFFVSPVLSVFPSCVLKGRVGMVWVEAPVVQACVQSCVEEVNTLCDRVWSSHTVCAKPNRFQGKKQQEFNFPFSFLLIFVPNLILCVFSPILTQYVGIADDLIDEDEDYEFDIDVPSVVIEGVPMYSILYLYSREDPPLPRIE